jgi:hypothetical protein
MWYVHFKRVSECLPQFRVIEVNLLMTLSETYTQAKIDSKRLGSCRPMLEVKDKGQLTEIHLTRATRSWAGTWDVGWWGQGMGCGVTRQDIGCRSWWKWTWQCSVMLVGDDMVWDMSAQFGNRGHMDPTTWHWALSLFLGWICWCVLLCAQLAQQIH